jgi:hypothetical protein
MDKQQIIAWLLEGGASIKHPEPHELLENNRKDLQDKIAQEGWGKQYLSKKNQRALGTAFLAAQMG